MEVTDAHSGSIDATAAVQAIKQLTSRYTVETIMTFGGEPLLFADTVCKIHETARDCGIEGRAVITNGFFSSKKENINQTAASLCAAGVDNVYLSVDAFHQEDIPIEPVVYFAESLLEHGVVIDTSDCYSACEVCRRVMAILIANGNYIFN